ncbi:type III secretion system ATPase SctN [Enterobacter hormaechei]|uniref:type III secretion system ATPase SctN n=1 Tax=Enterobacterales TaxID=91347 RepID=UPI000C9A8336|nr:MULTISPECIES: type III secretion system ATPase SctN [Enterobacterales]EKU3257669.1 type III secretion system ATPase SctN [Enterobacter hormaechei]EKV8300453.1 type III secretion system ATPase SctN [Enterobacter hormaechei]EKW3718101.1 type III secretion system ATPase SctN [Enterobacter hormaechei]EKW4845168.1 type III secretion system ATPase SctN [Enterobacter hormaechei]ELB7200793.1 type III secretion system ATPase SctN [Enterobacter hormaechei]
MVMRADLDSWFSQQQQRLRQPDAVSVCGRITGISGILLECSLPRARIGDLCRIERDGDSVMAEVVGFNPQHTLLSALGPLDGIAQGARVTPLYLPHSICVSDALLGCVLDGFGRPIDGQGVGAFALPGEAEHTIPVLGDAPPPTARPRISTPLPTGVRAIDGMLTIGVGQRVGVFAGAGCGKTTLLAELARNAPCDVIVFGLIGERGRELREFLDHELDEALRSRTVLICSTSDRSSMERARAAFTATAIAEAFREQGKSVLLILDSLTRFARAQREIGLALGEPPGRGGLPPSVYTLLPGLLERAGQTQSGAITALYSVLIEADSMNDPVADEVRSLIDGHIVLSRRLAERGHYPAIDVLTSLSRTMSNVVTREQMCDATQLRRMMAAWQQVEMLIRLGEYQPGHDAMTDAAVNAQPDINGYLRQATREPSEWQQTLQHLSEVSAHAPEN